MENIHWSIDNKNILNGIDLHVPAGRFVGLLGANGSGKSSLLKTIYRINKPQQGSITIDGVNINTLSIKETAKTIAVVAQETYMPFSLTVMELVEMGRTPHKSIFQTINEYDRQIAKDALLKVGLEHLADEYFQHLSGGEKQRVLVARALCQQARLLILDEPTNHLDIKYQLEILQLIKKLEVTVIAALHDINIAAMFCDEICLLKKGRIEHYGQPQQVITEDSILSIYGIHVKVKNTDHKVNVEYLQKL